MQTLFDAQLLNKIKKLSVSERILIVEDIWDSIAYSNENLPVTDRQKKELDKRLVSYSKNPSDGSSWKEVKSRIQIKEI